MEIAVPEQDVVHLDVHCAGAASAGLLCGRKGRSELSVPADPGAERCAAVCVEELCIHLLCGCGGSCCAVCLESWPARG